MANIARYHRKKLPSKKALKSKGFDEKTKQSIIVLSTFLRFAKTDRSHTGLVRRLNLSGRIKMEFCCRFIQTPTAASRSGASFRIGKRSMKPSKSSWMPNAY